MDNPENILTQTLRQSLQYDIDHDEDMKNSLLEHVWNFWCDTEPRLKKYNLDDVYTVEEYTDLLFTTILCNAANHTEYLNPKKAIA